MVARVTVVDYGAGNLLSVRRAFEHVGADISIATDPDAVARADYLVLPGVGAFSKGMEGLRHAGLVAPIQAHAAAHKPFLGICLGMQMMLSRSEEFGPCDGLGLLPGQVVPVPPTTVDGMTHKIPHVGWSGLVPADHDDWSATILADLCSGDAVYFVHSMAAQPSEPSHRIADTIYNGRRISAVIGHERLYGCQFHPEKSGPAGLSILAQFIALPT